MKLYERIVCVIEASGTNFGRGILRENGKSPKTGLGFFEIEKSKFAQNYSSAFKDDHGG